MANSDGGQRPVEAWANWPHPESELGAGIARAASPTNRKGIHPGLTFNKFAGFLARVEYDEQRRRAERDHAQGRKARWPKLTDQKRPVLERIATIHRDWAKEERELLTTLADRRSAAAQTLAEPANALIIHREVTLAWRVTSRLGEAHPFETGFMFHPVFGIPYLPGSGFKGAVRFAYWARHVAEATGPLAADARRTMRVIFGSDDPPIGERAPLGATEHERGAAVFFDVFPPADARLEVDVLNPHFPRWYQGHAQETDDQNPIPTFFLTATSTRPWQFLVVFAARNEPLRAVDSAECRGRLEAAIDDALTLWGVGAKTAAGYGLFTAADSSAKSLPTGTATTVDRSRHEAPTATVEPAEDLFLQRLRAFHERDYGQLRHLIEQIDRRADRAIALGILGARLRERYIGDRKRLKKLREDYPALAPHLETT